MGRGSDRSNAIRLAVKKAKNMTMPVMNHFFMLASSIFVVKVFVSESARGNRSSVIIQNVYLSGFGNHVKKPGTSRPGLRNVLILLCLFGQKDFSCCSVISGSHAIEIETRTNGCTIGITSVPTDVIVSWL